MSHSLSPKVTIAALAAAIVTIIVWLLGDFAGIDVPDLVQGAITTIIVFAAGYIKHDPARDNTERIVEGS